jgi:hypothetical protein
MSVLKEYLLGLHTKRVDGCNMVAESKVLKIIEELEGEERTILAIAQEQLSPSDRSRFSGWLIVSIGPERAHFLRSTS